MELGSVAKGMLIGFLLGMVAFLFQFVHIFNVLAENQQSTGFLFPLAIVVAFAASLGWFIVLVIFPTIIGAVAGFIYGLLRRRSPRTTVQAQNP